MNWGIFKDSVDKMLKNQGIDDPDSMEIEYFDFHPIPESLSISDDEKSFSITD